MKFNICSKTINEQLFKIIENQSTIVEKQIQLQLNNSERISKFENKTKNLIQSNCYQLYLNGIKSDGIYDIYPDNENESIKLIGSEDIFFFLFLIEIYSRHNFSEKLLIFVSLNLSLKIKRKQIFTYKKLKI